jgi:hypothetical protein
VSIFEQKLTAYEAEKEVFSTKISTGIHSTRPVSNGIPTHTPEEFRSRLNHLNTWDLCKKKWRQALFLPASPGLVSLSLRRAWLFMGRTGTIILGYR